MDSQHMRATVERYMEAVSTSNLQLIREIYSNNATVEDPVGTPAIEGIEAIEAFYKKVQGMGVKIELSGSIRCAGNFAAFPFKVMIGGGNSLEVIDTFEFDKDGKVISMRAYWGG